jgi:pSer/pThr/pTyr-binding forkhead associated (FHA) protein
MSFFLKVQSGPRKGNKIQLNPGRVLRIGRTSKSDFTFSEDSHMSSAHFSVDCREGYRIRDLKSSNGTLLNGERVNTAMLKSGDMIVAGETAFLVGTGEVSAEEVRTEGEEAALMQTDSKLPADATPQERLLFLLRHEFQPLYAVLDAARDIKILALLLQSKEEYQSLYEGQQGAKLAQVAPYLVRLKKDSLLLEKLVCEGWGQSWGVYLTCASEFQQVRRHFRYFLEVKLPNGKQVYFRFYDPRVLRIFLPTCTPEDTTQFFGPVQNYLVEDENPNKLFRFANTGKGSERIMIALVDRDELTPEEPPVEAESEGWHDSPLADGAK